MKDGRAQDDERHGDENFSVTRSQRQQQQPNERESSAGGERMRLGAAVGVETDKRLEERRRRLAGERDQADLAEVEMERAFQQRIDRRDQRLHHVVEEMAEADGGQNREGGVGPHTFWGFSRDGSYVRFHRCFRWFCSAAGVAGIVLRPLQTTIADAAALTNRYDSDSV